MTSGVPRLIAVMTLAVMSVAPQGCASLQGRDPLHVTVAGIEPLESQGMELRLLVKLRVQNPNDAPVDYSGVAVEMNVRGKAFATGVSDASGSVPRFGESLISVPVTVSAFRMVSHALDLMNSGASGPITYEMKGKLAGSGLNGTHFRTQGEFAFPASGAADQPTD
jgi:LEA14-like dessication related protein